MEDNDIYLLEKTALVEGRDRWFTHSSTLLGVGPLCLTDGPHGVRKALASSQTNGLSGAEKSTSFPTAAALACSWDPSLAFIEGETIAQECLYYDVQIVLGPGACLKRNPLCGRNFEYFSEDPLLSGEMAAGWIRGAENQGIGTSLKHYVCNNEENFRFVSNSVVDERSLHDLYLKNFEIAIKKGRPSTVMCSYNAVNGVWLSENEELIQKTLRDVWGFSGVVMTDWGATHDRIKGIRAGVDLDMPGCVSENRRQLINEYRNNPSFRPYLDASVERMKTLSKRFDHFTKIDTVDWSAHSQASLRVALDSAVLLKNEGILPFKKEMSFLAIGEFFEKMRYQGAGSSLLSPSEIVSPKQAFTKQNSTFDYEQGFSSSSPKNNDRLLKRAYDKAKSFETLVLFLGLDEPSEMEGFDRSSMELPKSQRDLVDALIPLRKKIVIVYFGGSPVELPFLSEIDALLAMYLPGQMGGEACYQLLFGESCPNGKLAETWPKHYSDVPFHKEYSTFRQAPYFEGIFVGYRYYLSHPENIRFPFGFGLSYTHFVYSDLMIKQNEDIMDVSFVVTNDGSCFGKEICQVYVSKKDSKTYRPVRELKSFFKVSLKPGESQKVSLSIPLADLQYFETAIHRSVLEAGAYLFEVGASSLDIRLSGEMVLQGETVQAPIKTQSYETVDFSHFDPREFTTLLQRDPPKISVPKECTEETLFSEYQGFLGNIIKKALVMGSKKALRKAKRMPPGDDRDNLIKDAIFIQRLMMNSCARSLKMSSGGALSSNGAKGFVAFGQGRFFKGLCYFLKKESRLPESGK